MTTQPARGARQQPQFSEQVSQKLHAARLWVVLDRPYYSRALLSCPLIPTHNEPTMAIAMDRRWRIYINPRYVEARTVDQVAAALIHEINHALRGHAERGRQIAASELIGYWMIACDLEINDDLKDDGLDVEGLLLPDRFGLEPYQTAETYYAQLVDASADLDDVPQCGTVCIAHPNEHRFDPGGVEGLSSVMQWTIRRATAELILGYDTDQDGLYDGVWDLPAGLLDWAQHTAGARTDWRQLLAQALRRSQNTQTGTADYTWQRPPRRCDPDDPVLRPALAAPTGHVAVVLDTSGSMGSDDHAQAFREIDAILTKAVPGAPVTVLSVDQDTQLIQSVTQARNITPVGGGGTNMAAGIETAAETNPNAIVVITDGYTPWPETPPPGAPTVIAALTNPSRADRVPAWIQAINITPERCL